mmetsp:Transcript_32021/g.69987  ORF Transcript_32021/g.69987 Transcript_32021/m.69987 type:complete len:319 (+) Transcript_32021:419-1375(+)
MRRTAATALWSMASTRKVSETSRRKVAMLKGPTSRGSELRSGSGRGGAVGAGATAGAVLALGAGGCRFARPLRGSTGNGATTGALGRGRLLSLAAQLFWILAPPFAPLISSKVIGPSACFVTCLPSDQPASWSSRRSRRRKRMRTGTSEAFVSLRTWSNTPPRDRRGPRCSCRALFDLSKTGPVTVSSAARHSKAAGQVSRWARRASQQVKSSLGESMPRTVSCPMSLILPSARCFRRARASSISCGSLSCDFAVHSELLCCSMAWKEVWHSRRRMARKPFEAVSLTEKAAESESKRLQRSAYIPMKLCCTQALPNIS